MPKKQTFWGDPARAAQTKEAMRASWAARRYFEITSRSTGLVSEVTDIEEVARVVRREPSTLRIYLARHKGVVTFAVDDDVLTVKRVYREA